MAFFSKKEIICPYCLATSRGKRIGKCSSCSKELPIQYINDYSDHPPFFIQVFGWPRVGKTVYLSALTLMLMKMSQVWPSYSSSPITEETQKKFMEINGSFSKGQMPPITPKENQDIFLIQLNDMELWGGKTLVIRDYAGEYFRGMNILSEKVPFLFKAPTTFMFISLPDIYQSTDGRSMDMLMNAYLTTFLKNKIDIKPQNRKIVVVLTKADLLEEELPTNLLKYLEDDPIWPAIDNTEINTLLDSTSMLEYIETMERVNNAIQNWIQQEAAGQLFIRLAQRNNIDLKFSLISSTGSEVGDDGNVPQKLEPRRVMDPFFWALEFQSQTQ